MAVPYTLGSNWDAGARYEATQEVPVLIVNPDIKTRAPLRWTITQSTAQPAISVDQAAVVNGGDDKGLTLQDGDFLWLAGVPGNTGTVEF